MSHDDEFDLDLERRLRRIAEEPQPPVPASVYRQAVAVTEERERGMGTYVSLRRYSRRGYRWMRGAVAVAAAVVVAVGAFGVISTLRQQTVAQTPTPPASASPAVSPSATPLPPRTTAPAPEEVHFTAPDTAPQRAVLLGAAPEAAWTAVNFGRAEMSDIPGFHAERWSGGWVEQGTGPQGEARWAWLSADGATWRTIGVGGDVHPSAAGLTAFDATFSTAWTSADGVSWTAHRTTGIAGRRFFEILGTPVGMVAPAFTLATPAEFAGVLYSADGVDWQPISLPVEGTLRGFRAVRTDGFFLGIAYVGTVERQTPIAFRSSDGRSWTATDPITGIGECAEAGSPMAARAGVVVLCGQAETVAVATTDGVVWQKVTEIGPVYQAPRLGDEVYLSSNGLRIVAQAGDGRLWSSFDGLHWTRLAGSAPVYYGGDYVGGQVQLGPRGLLWNAQTATMYGAAK